MMEVTINIPGLVELADAIRVLAGSKDVKVSTMVDGQLVEPQQTPQAQPVQQEQPVQQPVTPPVQQAQPVQPPVQQPQTATTAVPTSAPSYKLDDLARAAMTLMDAGRQAELQQLLGTFGVASLPELDTEQYGAFATVLRGMGAQI